jgi:nucleoside-diphosphate-sugar epimerase
MVASNLVLIANAGGVGRTALAQLLAQDAPVRAMVRRDDARAAELRALGAEVVVGDLTRPESVAAALEGVGRMYFAMPVSPDHLLAATVVATVAREHGKLDALVGMSQMTVSQMTATSTAESYQQRACRWYISDRRRSWTIRCSPRWRRNRSGTTARSRCRSVPGAHRRSPWTTSPG